jgi:hypothetical protein
MMAERLELLVRFWMDCVDATTSNIDSRADANVQFKTLRAP